MPHFKALVVREASHGFTRAIEQRHTDDLPPGDVLIRVQFSSLNHKDALSATGHKGVTRRYPHTPGIDAAGIVEESGDPALTPGQSVVVTGYDLGSNSPGGYGQYIRVPADWVVPLPAGLTPAESMALGTAGLTAALSILAFEEHGLTPARGPVLVTGASGGVGCLAVSILAGAGYRVIAATGKPEASDWLGTAGAAEVVPRQEVEPRENRGLAPTRWAGVVDTVGGWMLDAAIRATALHGVVTCCGMIASGTLTTSVFPFILRGVCLMGIDSVHVPMARRRAIWSRLAGDWKPAGLELLTKECGLSALNDPIDRMMAGRSMGRLRVRLDG